MQNSSRAPSVLALSLFVLSTLLSAPAGAQSSASLDAAVRDFEFAEFEKARDALTPIAEDPERDVGDRTRARTYLAATEHALGDEAAARAHLSILFREAPDTRLDPGLFLPELVRLSEEVRDEVALQRSLLEPRVDASAQPHVALALLPFGTGQFANGQTTKGLAFLAGEALLFGVSTLLYSQFSGLKEEDHGFLRGGTFADPEAARRLQLGYFATFWAGMALNVGGVVDALMTRQSSARVAQAASVPPPFPSVHERRP